MSSDAFQLAKLAILNAPFEERGWERATQAIADATRSSAANLLGVGGPLLLPLNVFAGDLPGIERYAGDPHFHGSINWRVGSVTEPMAIQYEAHYDAYRQLHDTADYDDAASDLDIQFGCQSAVLLDSRNLFGVALLRSRRDGPCTAETLTRFSVLRMKVSRAVRMQLALDGEAAEMMLGDMSALQSATLLLDRHGSVSALSPSAESLFDEGGPLMLDGLVPRFRSRTFDGCYEAALGRAVRSGGGPAHAFEQFSAGNWRVAIVGLPAREDGLGFDPHIAVTFRSRPGWKAEARQARG